MRFHRAAFVTLAMILTSGQVAFTQELEKVQKSAKPSNPAVIQHNENYDSVEPTERAFWSKVYFGSEYPKHAFELEGFSSGEFESQATRTLFAAAVSQPVPSGYTWVKSSPSNTVILYRKGTENTYVQVINLNAGAKVKFKTGDYAGTSTAYGNEYKVLSMSSFWSKYQNDAGIFSIVNGQFFKISGYYFGSAPLSYGTKSNGSILSNGFDSNDGLSKKMLEIYGTYASVRGYSSSNFTTSSAPNVIVGLDPSVNKSSTTKTGRFYLAACHPTMTTPQNPLVIMLSSDSMTQADAYCEIKKWAGVQDYAIIMMDGSGSAQLDTSSGLLVGSWINRNLPMVIGTYDK